MGRIFRAASAALALAATATATLAVAVPGTAGAAANGDLAPDRLRANALTQPLGIEDTRPDLSWELAAARGGSSGSASRNLAQTAYEIRAATSERLLQRGRADLWNSGRVSSPRSHGIRYAGRTVGSRAHVAWQVRVWDQRGRASRWSEPTSWETGLLDRADWSAQWIGNPAWEDNARAAHPITVTLSRAQEARFVRLDVRHLAGSLVDPFEPDRRAQLQLAELEVLDSAAPDDNLAEDAAVTASESETVAGEWEPRFLTDGVLTTARAPFGYSSASHASLNVGDAPIWITLDLGEPRRFDQLRLYPRTDVKDQFGRTANYPRDYSVSVGATADGAFARVFDRTRQDPPSALRRQPEALPQFATSFDVGKPLASARLYVTGVGIYQPTLNGAPISSAVLEPPNTSYERRLVASAYDLTAQLRPGENRLGVELGQGQIDTHNVPAQPRRFQYMSTDWSPPRLLAQVELTYADGSRRTIRSDGSWQTGLGATTFSNWYGGEDYDARRELPGWDAPGFDAAAHGWQSAQVTAAPFPGAQISARTAPPIEPVETRPAVAVAEPKPGTYVIDFGVNVAGWPELTLGAAAGTQVKLEPAEKLKEDGTITQSGFRGPVWDTLTLSGDGEDTWHPRFMYHGFRYLQVTGLPQAPTTAQARAIVLRAANEQAGSFHSSHELLNGIHAIIDRAIQGNMYSVLTDCPHREKLAWLEQAHLVFGSVSRNYDVQAYYRKLVQDMADAQLPSGLVPDITPELTEFTEWDLGYRDDVNWGGALIRAPWLMYEAYGDVETLRTYYPNMQRYMEYLQSRADGALLATGLGDWIAIDTSTPRELTASYGWIRMARVMEQIATVLGRGDDAAAYAALATRVGDAVNAKYLHPDRHTYATGNQAADALALHAGIVPAEHRDAVLEHLIAGIRAQDNHLTVGEIALPAVLDVLGDAGRDDVISDLATQTTGPSYGRQVLTGSTTLGEAWDGLEGDASQNHFMLGAIDEWFTKGLGGIRQAAGSTAWRRLDVRPAVVGELTSNEASYRTPQGWVRTAWTRDDRRLDLDVEVPIGSTATVTVPLDRVGGSGARLKATRGATLVRVTDAAAVYRVGSGAWAFSARAAR